MKGISSIQLYVHLKIHVDNISYLEIFTHTHMYAITHISEILNINNLVFFKNESFLSLLFIQICYSFNLQRYSHNVLTTPYLQVHNKSNFPFDFMTPLKDMYSIKRGLIA